MGKDKRQGTNEKRKRGCLLSGLGWQLDEIADNNFSLFPFLIFLLHYYRFWLVSLRAMVRYRWCTIGGKERRQVIANRYQVIGNGERFES